MGSGNSTSPTNDDRSDVAAQSEKPGLDDAVAGDLGLRAKAGRHAEWAGVGLVAVMAIVAMAPALRGTFLPGDDQYFVVNHVCVNRPGLLNTLRLFVIIHRDLYQPIPMVSFALDTAIYDHHAWGFHLTNVVLHAVGAVLVRLLVRMRFQDWWLATVAAGLFAVHPQGVESSAAVTTRFVQMGVVFSLAAVICFLIWSRHSAGEGGWLAAAVLLAVLAMMSKVQVALPVLLLLMVYGQTSRSARHWWTAWSVLCGITVAFAVLALWTTARSGLVAGAMAGMPGSLPGRALMAMGIYLRNLFCPVRLSTWYVAPASWSWSHLLIWLGCAGLVGLIAMAAGCIVRRRWAMGIGLTWYLAAIVPMLWASSARNLIAADRYTYMANIGAFLAIGALVVAGLRLGPSTARPRVAVSAAALGTVAVFLVGASWSHAAHYRTGLAYYSRVADLYPHEPWANLNVGWELAQAGRLDDAQQAAQAEIDLPQGDRARARQLCGWIAEKRGQLDLAEQHYAASAEALKGDAEAQYMLAQLLRKQGRLDRACAVYERALAIHPGHLPSLLGLASALERAHRLQQAADVLNRALRINPQHVDALTRLATIRLQQGHREVAEELFVRALEVAPDHVQARTNLATIMAQTGRQKEALDLYNSVLAEHPRLVSARLNRADLRRQWGHNANAADDYRAVLSIDPGCLPALNGMEDILYIVSPGDAPVRATQMWTEAVATTGPRPDLLAGLAMSQASAGMIDQAEQTARRCLANAPDDPLASLTLAIVAMNRKQPEPAIEAVERVCSRRGAEADAETLQRASRTIGLYGLQHRSEPLPYFLLGRILLAQNQLPLAGQTFDELMKVSRDPIWRDRIRQVLTTGRVAATRPAATTRSTSRPTSRPPTTLNATH